MDLKLNEGDAAPQALYKTFLKSRPQDGANTPLSSVLQLDSLERPIDF